MITKKNTNMKIKFLKQKILNKKYTRPLFFFKMKHYTIVSKVKCGQTRV